ncbi:hypothetical protein F5X97DRAFT_330990 [Nemania serpens]|nr:hypothetical protein F5X97DRAFT_330990 [Nemania serpens]
MNVRRETIDDAHPATCDWLFGTVEFEEWLDREDLLTHNGVFWIKGKPGAGKSTLMNHTLSFCERVFGDHLIVAYFFNARGGVLEKSPLGMMRSIVYQLLDKDDTLYGAFVKLYRENQMIHGSNEFQWRELEIKKFIRSIAKQPRLQPKPLLLIIDALDECVEKDVRDVVIFLETLSINAVGFGVELRICLSSRHYPSISMKKNLALTLEGREEHGTDIATYVREKLNTNNSSIKYQIEMKAGGVFMWVVLVVAMLNKAYDEGRHEAMQKTLDEVPEDLEALFNSILEKGDSNKTELIRMLQWVLFAQRPLTPEDLYMVVVGRPPPSHEVIRRRINSSSKGLIEIRKDSADKEFVQFIHLSVKDFLYRNRRLEMLDPTLQPDAISASHGCLWAVCRSYLQDLNSTSTEGEHMTEVPDDGSFLKYAATYIFAHADKALASDEISPCGNHDMIQWLAARGGWHQWIKYPLIHHKSLTPIGIFMNYTIDAALILILLYGWYGNLLRFAIDNGADVNANGGLYGSSLQAASKLGRGANVNKQGGLYCTALQAASASGTFEVVDLLIENGADIDAQNELLGNALRAAIHFEIQILGKMSIERRKIVMRLLEKGVKCDRSVLNEFIAHSEKIGTHDLFGRSWSSLCSLAGR